jgi:hypothetical protein
MTSAQQEQDEELIKSELKLIPKDELARMIAENSEQTLPALRKQQA